MNAFIIKIIALVSMLIDHTGCMLAVMEKLSASQYLVMRSLGRIAFPLYAFLIVEGFEKTSDRVKYLARLCLFAALSQIPYNFAPLTSSASPAAAEYFFSFRSDAVYLVVLAILLLAFALSVIRKKYIRLCGSVLAAYIIAGASCTLGGVAILTGELNVFYTLACSLAVLCITDMIERREEYNVYDIAAAVVLTAGCCIAILGRSDYGYKGLTLIFALYVFRNNRVMQALSLVLWSVWVYTPTGTSGLCLCLAAALSAVPVLFYSGSQGKKTRAFYYAYPAHLILLGIIYRLAI
jgi:hypothetical protein